MRVLNEVGIEIISNAIKAQHKEIERIKSGKICEEKNCKCDKCKKYKDAIKALKRLEEIE